MRKAMIRIGDEQFCRPLEEFQRDDGKTSYLVNVPVRAAAIAAREGLKVACSAVDGFSEPKPLIWDTFHLSCGDGGKCKKSDRVVGVFELRPLSPERAQSSV